MQKDLKKYVIIVAGGIGKRMDSPIPKQFILLGGLPLIMYTINRFREYDSGIKIVVVLPEPEIGRWNSLCRQYSFKPEHIVTGGGERRYFSVKNGLQYVNEESLVAVHDGVRPLVSTGTIKRCFDMAALKGNAVPVIEPSESVREVDVKGINRRLDREKIRLVQTPQVFRSDLLLRAYNSKYSPSYTDDATVVEQLGVNINLVPGNRENIKITTPKDMVIAEAIIGIER